MKLRKVQRCKVLASKLPKNHPSAHRVRAGMVASHVWPQTETGCYKQNDPCNTARSQQMGGSLATYIFIVGVLISFINPAVFCNPIRYVAFFT